MKIYLIFLIIFVSCKSSSQSGYHKVLQTDFEPESGKIGDTDHLNSLQTDQSFSTTLLPADWVVLGD